MAAKPINSQAQATLASMAMPTQMKASAQPTASARLETPAPRGMRISLIGLLPSVRARTVGAGAAMRYDLDQVRQERAWKPASQQTSQAGDRQRPGPSDRLRRTPEPPRLTRARKDGGFRG